MMYLQHVFDKVTEYLVNDCPVYVTDGTVTRRVVAAGIDEKSLMLQMGMARDRVEIPEAALSASDGWGMAELEDGLYIAPEWWLAI